VTGRRLGTIGEIWRYPVKSMGGERLDEVAVTAAGLTGDRAWAVRDTAAGEIRGAKRIPPLLLCTASFLEEPGPNGGETPVEVTLPDGSTVRSGDSDVAGRLSAALGREVTLEALRPADDEEHYRAGPRDPSEDPRAAARTILGLEEGDEFPDLSGLPAEERGFATFPGTYLDAYPLHLLTTAFDVRRFRPNLLVESDASQDGFAEFDWAGADVRLGEVVVHVETSTVRCAMPMHAQAGLGASRETLRTLIEHSGQHLGVYATVVTPGTVGTGDEVTIEG
jgi:uncharacterized protein YcbX